MDLREEFGEREPPAWAAEPAAWGACLATATLPTALLDALLRTLKSPIAPTATFGVYVCAFTLLVWTSRPWSARAPAAR